MDKKKILNILVIVVAVILVFSIVNKVRKDKVAGEIKDKEPQVTEETNEDTTDEDVDKDSESEAIEEDTGETEEEDSEVVESVMSIQGEVKEIFENGDIRIDSDNNSEDPTVILKAAAEDMKEVDLEVGDKVIAFTKAGTPQTMELPMSFRYGALEIIDEDLIYKAGIFDKEGLSDNGMLQLNIPEGEDFEFAGEAVVVKYKMSTKSIPEQVSDFEILELAK